MPLVGRSALRVLKTEMDLFSSLWVDPHLVCGFHQLVFYESSLKKGRRFIRSPGNLIRPDNEDKLNAGFVFSSCTHSTLMAPPAIVPTQGFQTQRVHEMCKFGTFQTPNQLHLKGFSWTSMRMLQPQIPLVNTASNRSPRRRGRVLEFRPHHTRRRWSSGPISPWPGGTKTNFTDSFT